MTYSEVREMYTMEMTELLETRDRNRRILRDAAALLLAWLMPWAVTCAAIILSPALTGCQKSVLSAALLALSFLYWKKINAENRSVFLFGSCLSYLVAFAAVANVTLA